MCIVKIYTHISLTAIEPVIVRAQSEFSSLYMSLKKGLIPP